MVARQSAKALIATRVVLAGATTNAAVVRQLKRWTSFQVVHRRDTGKVDRPFQDGLFTAPDKEALQLIRKMGLLNGRIVDGAGFPPPNRILDYHHADAIEPPIYRLKFKPSCWRMYVYADQENARLIYLHIVCKKRNRLNENDTTRARWVLGEHLSGRWSIEQLEF